MNGLRRAVGVSIVLGLCVVAVVRTLDEAQREPLAPLTPARRESVATEIAAREPGLRARSKRQFPGDVWSQDDAFHAEEQHLVRRAAEREHADLGSVLDALDAFLRTHPSPDRPATASPCKPRPFYD